MEKHWRLSKQNNQARYSAHCRGGAAHVTCKNHFAFQTVTAFYDEVFPALEEVLDKNVEDNC